MEIVGALEGHTQTQVCFWRGMGVLVASQMVERQ